MSFFDKYIKAVRYLLPSPFTIAIVLTLFTLILGVIWPSHNIVEEISWSQKVLKVLTYWNAGLWNTKGLAFAIQMMLMLLLGHVLALSKPIDNLINQILPFCKNNAKSALLVTLFTLMVSWFNWGLGLVFGAIFCKKIMEYASKASIPLNYGLIGAAGYSGLMIWHGGISGSSLVKISEPGHLKDLVPQNVQNNVPEIIDFSQTVFSTMNIYITLALLVVLPLSMYVLGKKASVKVPAISFNKEKINQKIKLIGAEKIDQSKFTGTIVGLLVVVFCIFLAINHPSTKTFQFINPNYLNLSLLGLALLCHGNINNFINSVEKAIGGTAGILIQFPLYFGIMGIVKETGMINDIASYFQTISTELTYPLYTLLSAGMVNFFVPSGGGQWYIQGPLVIQSSLEMGIPLHKSILALAYGDQLTNMMQPFWALPLLGITGLKAKDILPYTFILMFIGLLIFSLGLVIF
jgi:short-chain fatty acids transporter